ncbi:MAG: hypothetical protein JST01_13555 [Cyanobacteria bacterium SZAS TMP-1]|nr:hypothetical protein [Cyanobacteria bacterium SZAS TMP-1]
MTMLAKWLRKASSLFAEKPEVKPDDFGMEHFLLYHGLAGSSPENQRQFKDVRADVLSALSRKNSQNLCINLKLAPLWWEEKLQRIFAEAKAESIDATVGCLLPTVASTDEAASQDPLMHQDWRVRANAAAMLAYLGAHQGQERMIAALHDTARSGSPAFCHVARSLAEFRTVTAKEALAEHLLHPEPWIRVDAVNALARWPFSDTVDLMIQAFGEHHDFIDYACVALARAHKPSDLLAADDEQTVELGANCLLGLLEAAHGTFSSNTDLLPELAVQKCLAPLQAACTKNPTPAKLRALSQLSLWLDTNYHQYRLEAEGYPSQEEIAAARSLADESIKKLDINRVLQATHAQGAGSPSRARKTAMRNAIKLAGEHKLTATTATLLDLLNESSIYRDEIIETLGLIGDTQCAATLIKMARALVNMEHRTQGTLSADPIAEASADKARTYWYILRALGHLPGDEALAFLLEASQDEAADKREEALSSLIKIWSATGGKLARAGEVKAVLQKCTSDPSAQVRIRAIEGVAALNLPDLIPAVAKLTNAQEMSVGRAAFNSLEKLAAAGHKEAIGRALGELKQGQSNAVKVKRIDDFMKHHL